MKKPYEAPKLSEHGDIRSLTEGEYQLDFSESGIWKKPRPQTGSN
ncbi:MAG: lasso RiPP family leader peptide-containing protein [Dehalococcoidia bacterium]|nr:lasso RiPP family leader peptide-containing protein [Dehalococcoidia bacterium]